VTTEQMEGVNSAAARIAMINHADGSVE